METLTKTGNIVLDSFHNSKKIVFDARFHTSGQGKPIIIFIHGFKGFKDWGHFNLIADYFASKGYVFIKLNLSHNGTTPENPEDFVDLNAFGNNNYTIELDDLETLLSYIFNAENEAIPAPEMDLKNIFFIGHSRGGAVAILKAREDERVKGLVTWAAVSDIAKRWPKEFIEEWKEKGVQYVLNGRTKQQMPLFYQLWEDFEKNKSRLDIPEAVWQLEKPMLIIHGFDDEALPVSSAFEMSEWNPENEVLFIENANHTFGGYHPYDKEVLPEQTLLICERTNEFFEKIIKEKL
jgi:uncharacterized protein